MKRWFFDLGFGVGLPLFCLWLDPLVFKHAGMGRPLLGFLRPEAYLTIALCMGALLIWKMSQRDPWGILAGLMLLGGVMSALVALLLLPVSFVGLLFGVGVMGVLPWLCAWVFLRNMRDALRAGRPSGNPDKSGPRRMIFAALMALAFVGWGGHQARNARHFISAQAGSADPAARKAAVDSLRKWRWLIGEDFLVEDYLKLPGNHPANAWRVQVYEYVTGRDFESSIAEVFNE